MTDPTIGRAEIEVHADTKPVPGEAKRGMEEALTQVDPTIKKHGEAWGEELAQSSSTRMKSRLPELVDKAIADINRGKIKEHVKVETETDVDHDSVKNAVRDIARDVEKELSQSGLFSFIGQGIADAIGSGFNVSGKSPLIFALVPVIGAIAALVVGAIQAVNGLAAALLTIPNLISAIVLEAGVLYLIFRDISSEITKAFAAQNAKELQNAIKGLDPYVQNFILELVYIRNEFRDLTKYLDIQFFKNLGNVLLDIFNFNRYTLFTGLFNLAAQLGTWFNTVGKAFQTPQFAKFLYDLFQAIDKFLASNGPTLQRFLTQVFTFLDSLMGATGDVGALFNDFLKTFGNWLEETAKSKEFQDWLKELPALLTDAGRLIAVLLDLVITLFSSIDKAGGQKFVDQLVFMIGLLAQFFSTDTGIKSLQLLMITILVLTAAFVDLVIAVGALLGWLQQLGDWILNTAGPAIKDFFVKLGHAIADGFTPKPIAEFLGKIKDAFTFLVDQAPEWGKNLIKGFIAGMLGQKGNLHGATVGIVGVVSDGMPHSPAKYGPFSGDGAPEQRGRDTMADFAKGLMAGGTAARNDVSNAMSNINFGPGAIIANFNGQLPSREQAEALGTAVGNGINNQLVARDARLAVRTM